MVLEFCFPLSFCFIEEWAISFILLSIIGLAFFVFKILQK